MKQQREHIIPYLLFFSFTLWTVTLNAQDYEAKLKMDWEDGSRVIEGTFFNNTKQSLQLNFQLSIERKSKTGNVSNNRQSGSFQIASNRSKLVALTEINIDELDFYRIYLKIYKKGKIIAEDHIVKWEELNVELSDRNKPSNEEKKPHINFYTQKEVHKNKTVLSPTPSILKPESAVQPDKKVGSKNNASKKRAEQTTSQNKKQTYTTTPTEIGTKQKAPNANTSAIATTTDAEKTKRQAATKKLLADLIQQNTTTKTNQAAAKTKPPSPTSNTTNTKSATSTDVEFGGLIFDDSRTKTGRDFYDIFYANYIPPKGAENFNITIKELPGRGRLAQIAVLVDDKQVLLRLLQPRFSIVEEQAIQSVYAVEGYLKNAAQLKKQLDSADQQGSGIF